MLDQSDGPTTMECTHVLKLAAGGIDSPLDALAFITRTLIVHSLTGTPRSRIRSLACCTVYSP